MEPNLLQARQPSPPLQASADTQEIRTAAMKQLSRSLKVPPWVPMSRANQFDAAKLDVEMTAMLKEQLMKVFSLMQPGFLSRYEPELEAFLEFLIWRFSIWVDKPTPGNALMNLRYRDERAFSSLVTFGKVRTGLEGPGLTRFRSLDTVWPWSVVDMDGPDFKRSLRFANGVTVSKAHGVAKHGCHCKGQKMCFKLQVLSIYFSFFGQDDIGAL